MRFLAAKYHSTTAAKWEKNKLIFFMSQTPKAHIDFMSFWIGRFFLRFASVLGTLILETHLRHPIIEKKNEIYDWHCTQPFRPHSISLANLFTAELSKSISCRVRPTFKIVCRYQFRGRYTFFRSRSLRHIRSFRLGWECSIWLRRRFHLEATWVFERVGLVVRRLASEIFQRLMHSDVDQ